MKTESIQQSKAPVMIRREMAAVPAVMDALDNIERTIFSASVAKTVTEYDSRELTAELALALKWICKDIGYRMTGPDDEQYLIIRTGEILKRYYPGFTLKDFRLAFEMLAAGELDAYLPKGRDGQPERNHYQMFNAAYICRVLNAYRDRRGWVFRKAAAALPKPEPKADPEQIKRHDNASRKDCITAFLEYKYTGAMPTMSPVGEMLCYNLLSGVGLAEDIDVTLAEQEEILRITINGYTRQGRAWDAQRLADSGAGDPELEHGAKVLARRKALLRTFAWMAENEIQITDYIKMQR